MSRRKLKHDPPNSFESTLIGGTIQQNSEKVKRANPIKYLTEDAPPFRMTHTLIKSLKIEISVLPTLPWLSINYARTTASVAPDRVRAALNTLVEGVLILDPRLVERFIAVVEARDFLTIG